MGCLRFSNGQSETSSGSPVEATPSATDEPEQGDEPNDGSVFYSTREEAIDYVGSFARGDPQTSFENEDRDESKLLAFSTSSSGTSGGSGPNESNFMSEDMIVESIAPGGFAFGGGSGRSLRVRNLANDSTLTYEPNADTESYDVESIDIETDGEGQLREETPHFDVARSDGEPISIPGSWSGDNELFTHQLFARYVVELVEDRSVVGETEGEIYGKAYQFGFDQTETTAFITRQHAVKEDWEATFYLGSAFQPDDSVTATHRPDIGVFEIDLTTLAVESGEYDWSFQLSKSDSMNTQTRFIQLRSVFGNTVYIQ